ncbi:phosphate ABC transporter substrate-binding protein PstS [Thioflavicoccus mobilis]|uniref:phosphate ABC transporter substrate-binding protein PstS n=1 Tax=Thioflavicoccus mobilis TaxID=80679 RepID=UPI000303A84C|nr:phosphate ABC transporter substrate-binding protein PstS [Thioflavicoccus mobilis]
MRTTLVVALATIASACHAPSGGGVDDAAAVDDGSLRIRGAGATFPEPLYQEWLDRYSEVTPEVAFSYVGVGSGEGIRRFIAEEVDFGASDAAMSDAEIARVTRGVELIPATAGMVVLAYNLPGVAGDLRLPRDVYVDIFLGRIWRWDNPRIVAANPHLDLPAKVIQTVVRRDGSGTTFAFTSHLSAISVVWRDEGPGIGKEIDWPGGAMAVKGNEGVAQRVKLSPGTIGYMEYGFARRLGLPIATLENRAGRFVRPDAASGSAALAAAADAMPSDLRLFLPDPAGPDSYPVVSLSWILAYGRYSEPARAEALKGLFRWALQDGQPVAETLGYIPLPEPIATKAATAVAEIR